ncbi:hypothetical protein EV649_4986 [Kribbella sp. VKM Ac-2569]|uniref:hypothetical protein n=1 Tax=Kribbella sp. VKM Ac-2569 TaxID=2512220 RepID=UPI00102BB5B9|nr:hypothetical protein [Kribbella sp. VKM Ac-2569]RZT17446.1 hypothetical protein EV649_4986 [Kribbella sp. VKM Ac-2569]
MNHKRIIITAPVLAVAALAFASAESNAKVPANEPHPAVVAPRDPAPSNYAVPTQPATSSTIVSDDNTAEAFQAAASGLGGAGIALAAMWLYRRHQTHTA